MRTLAILSIFRPIFKAKQQHHTKHPTQKMSHFSDLYKCKQKTHVRHMCLCGVVTALTHRKMSIFFLDVRLKGTEQQKRVSHITRCYNKRLEQMVRI